LHRLIEKPTEPLPKGGDRAVYRGKKIEHDFCAAYRSPMVREPSHHVEHCDCPNDLPEYPHPPPNTFHRSSPCPRKMTARSRGILAAQPMNAPGKALGSVLRWRVGKLVFVLD